MSGWLWPPHTYGNCRYIVVMTKLHRSKSHPSYAEPGAPPRQRQRPSRLRRILRRCVIWFLSLLWMSVFLVILAGIFPLPTTSFMLQTSLRNGPYRYQWKSYEQIAPEMALAAIAAEDQRFPSHSGFDFDAIEAAMADYERGGELRGASTISQQVAKNLFLWPGRSTVRKGLEAWFTLLIELIWSKERILLVYVNVAQFGDRIFGVGAASQQFFQIPARDLTAAEAALLAAVLPGPELYDVGEPSYEVLAKQDWILSQMDQLGGVGYLQQLYDPPQNE